MVAAIAGGDAGHAADDLISRRLKPAVLGGFGLGGKVEALEGSEQLLRMAHKNIRWRCGQ